MIRFTNISQHAFDRNMQKVTEFNIVVNQFLYNTIACFEAFIPIVCLYAILYYLFWLKCGTLVT